MTSHITKHKNKRKTLPPPQFDDGGSESGGPAATALAENGEHDETTFSDTSVRKRHKVMPTRGI
jgi:hypothetical protein